MDTNKMRDPVREQFEAAYLAESTRRNGRTYPSVLTRGDDGNYVIPSVQSAWWAWQASRESLIVKLPPVRPEPVLTGEAQKTDGEAATWSMWAGEKLAKDDCRAAIEAQGLKVEVKP
ncbi:hypothetical protein GLGCALEP_03459 [Pseudomonas sp. MM221]|nr:hypothetical protein DBADOPDK_03384 [Pseudomonas sp. MM223]CAI3804322.1 hypothetical protein GLGCALEP_03459 [Pseudomonas sp. MM221]